MPARKKSDYFKAREAFGVMFEGEQITVPAGEIVPAGHPLLKGRGELFEPVVSFGRFDTAERPEVEQATAAPGEKRG